MAAREDGGGVRSISSILGLEVVQEGYFVWRPFTGSREVLRHLVCVSGGWTAPRCPVGSTAAAVGLVELRNLNVLVAYVCLQDGRCSVDIGNEARRLSIIDEREIP